MEQHPIPRQITSFEFKLIGFLTLKQFLYLLVAVPTAFVVFKLIPIPIVNYLLATGVVGIGAAFAFLPVEDRPLDVWIRNLYKRLTSPTQYTYGKHNQPLYFLNNLYFLADPHKVVAHVDSQEKLSLYLQKTRPRPPPNANKQHIQTLLQKPTTNLRTQTNVMPLQSILGQKQPINTQSHVGMTVVPPPFVQQFPQSQVQISQPVSQPPVTLENLSQVAPPVMSPSVSQTIQQPQQAEQLPPLMQVEVQHQQYIPPQAVVTSQPTRQVEGSVPVGQTGLGPDSAAVINNPLNFAPTITPQTQGYGTVTTIQQTPEVSKVSKAPFFTGVIRSNKSIAIPGILVYVKDLQGTPLRLLKTNPHGVFATFNPLPEGDYIFEMKDPKNSFYFDTMNVPIRSTNPVPFEFRSKEIL